MTGPTAADPDGILTAAQPWLIVDGREIPPVPRYAPQSWWQRLLRRPRRQVGWLTGPFTAPAPEVVVRVEWRMSDELRDRVRDFWIDDVSMPEGDPSTWGPWPA